MSIHRPPCVMSDTEQFYVCLCACGVVHLSFGPTVINATPETVIALSETLREVSQELRRRLAAPENVIRGHFPSA